MKKMFVITIALVLLIAVFSGCANASVQPEPPAKTTEKKVDVQGKLNGWIDNNSVEIEINSEDTLAFRVTDVLNQMNGVNDGDAVKFSYEENEYGQLNISKIEKVN